MATLYPVAGCRIFIGPSITIPDVDMVAADFASITWTEIQGWETMGPMGDDRALITTPLIARDRDMKTVGTKNAPARTDNFAEIPHDPGQIALQAAAETRFNFPFKIELNDKPATGGAPKNSLRYFAGIVKSAVEQGGGANTVRMLNSNIEVNTNTVRVAASAT
jgi:hypothetical protein